MKAEEYVKDWLKKCGHVLQNLKETGQILDLTLNVTKSAGFSESRFQGRSHSKGPQAKLDAFQWTVVVSVPNSKASIEGQCFVEIKGTGALSPAALESKILKSLRFAAISKYTKKVSEQFSYLPLNFSDDSLTKIFENPEGGEVKVRGYLDRLDQHLARFKHTKLLGHECHASISHTVAGYWDTQKNLAVQVSSSVDLSFGVALLDFSDFGSETYGHFPSEKEVDTFFEDAIAQLIESPLQPLVVTAEMNIVLLPQALLTLLGDLLFPNLKARALLKGESRYNLQDLGKTVCAKLTVRDSPHEQGSPFSQIFDFEGRPSKSCFLLKNGEFVQPLLTSSQLQELNDRFTADQKNSCGNLTLSGHASGLDSTSFTNLYVELDDVPLCPVSYEQSAQTVVVVNSLTGMSANPLTGGFSLDAEGARVFIGGKLSYTCNFTLSGGLDELLNDPNLVRLPGKRIYNATVPGILTKKLQCVSKGQGSEAEI